MFDCLVADKSATDGAGEVFIRAIASPDDLDKTELMRCFYLLHACGRATQPDASLATTRKSIEGFLSAIFNSWSVGGDKDENEIQENNKPVLNVHVDADAEAGRICGELTLTHTLF